MNGAGTGMQILIVLKISFIPYTTLAMMTDIS